MSDKGGDLDSRILELYKMAVEMADRVSARRGTANAFFISVQTAVVSILSLSYSKPAEASWLIYLVVSLAGVTISASWWLQLRSYRELNKAKFAVINKIEEGLPVKIFTDEWGLLKRDLLPPLRKRYAELGVVERVVPFVFALLYVLFFVDRVSS